MRHRLMQREAFSCVPLQHPERPLCILHRDRPIQAELGADARGFGRRGRGRNEKRRSVTRSQTDEREGDGEHQPEQQQRAGESAQHGARMHALKLHRTTRVSTVLWMLAATAVDACFAPQRATDIVVYASGTDLESGNPLVTVHSLSRQIQRFALLVTLAKYDSALTPVPYAASRWEWSSDRRTLLFHLVGDLRWHDGTP